MNNSIYGTTDPDYEQDGFQISQERCEGFSHCVNICPVEALTLVEGYVNEILNIRALYVQLDTCIMCGVCEPECPTEAIMLRLSGGSPGTTPGTNPGSDGGGTGGNSSGSFSAIAPVSTINLEDRLNCFNNVVDNINTTYKVTLNAHRIDPILINRGMLILLLKNQTETSYSGYHMASTQNPVQHRLPCNLLPVLWEKNRVMNTEEVTQDIAFMLPRHNSI
ncbi:MAG TPA: hypothetical protein DCG88_00565 [Sphingobacterium sp.]|nr:hypothetical protein [Sphingobacterium sp.]